jgi:hypothetical protein
MIFPGLSRQTKGVPKAAKKQDFCVTLMQRPVYGQPKKSAPNDTGCFDSQNQAKNEFADKHVPGPT